MSRIEIRLTRGGASFQDQPLCSMAEVTKAIREVTKLGMAFFNRLLEEDRWHDKQKDILRADEVVNSISVFNQLCQENRSLLQLIFMSHDLGRVVESLHRQGIWQVKAERHPIESVKVLRSWGIDKYFESKAWEVISYSIEHHTDQTSPLIPDDLNDMEKLKRVIACFLRDIDKLDTFTQTTDLYLFDKEKRADEMAKHGFVEEKTVNPDFFLKMLAQHVTPPRNSIVSYEAYMVYFLGWIFDVSLPEVLRQIVQSGAITKLLDYFKRQLPEEQYESIQLATVSFLEKHEISIS